MKSLKDLNQATGRTLYAYAVNNAPVTRFLTLSELQDIVAPVGAKIIKTEVPKETNMN